MSSSAPAPSPKPVQIHVTEDGGVECSSNSCGRSGYCIGGILFVDRPACFELKFCSCLSLPLSPFLSVDLYKFQAPLQQSHPSYFVLNRFHCFVFVLLFFFPAGNGQQRRRSIQDLTVAGTESSQVMSLISSLSFSEVDAVSVQGNWSGNLYLWYFCRNHVEAWQNAVPFIAFKSDTTRVIYEWALDDQWFRYSSYSIYHFLCTNSSCVLLNLTQGRCYTGKPLPLFM